MLNFKFTIIMPAYNAENTIEQNYTFKNIYKIISL